MAEGCLRWGIGTFQLSMQDPRCHMGWGPACWASQAHGDLRQAGLLPSHGETKTGGDTYLYPAQEEGGEDPPHFWKPKRVQGMRRSYRATS